MLHRIPTSNVPSFDSRPLLRQRRSHNLDSVFAPLRRFTHPQDRKASKIGSKDHHGTMSDVLEAVLHFVT